MLCKALSTFPQNENWSFEIKFDGYRCIAVKQGSEVTLFSRNRKVFNDRFPNLVEAVKAINGDFVLDGEIVALDDQGKPSFQLLQNNRSGSLAVWLYIFDLLIWNGESLLGKTLERRRQQLNELLAVTNEPLRLSPVLEAAADQVLEAVQKLGLEGVVGKRYGSIYEAGERTGAWIKHRTNREQNFIIGGYTPGAHGFSSLLVGVYQGKALSFVAKVKNGFTSSKRDRIFQSLKTLSTPKCPFTNLPEKKAARCGEPLTTAPGVPVTSGQISTHCY
jgi:DNA ligase D-like protein (predicted ligase)